MKSLMNRWADKPRLVELTLDATELAPDTRTVLDLSAETINRFLANLRADETRLTATIAEAQETLRMTRVSIAAFVAAEGIILDSVQPAVMRPADG